MSSRFAFKNFDTNYIKKRIDRIKEIIRSKKRDYVFVTGNAKEIFKNFEVAPPQSYKIQNKKFDVYIGAKLIDDVRYCFIKSYKAQGFDGIHMQEYGRLCRGVLDNL